MRIPTMIKMVPKMEAGVNGSPRKIMPEKEDQTGVIEPKEEFFATDIFPAA